MRVAYVTPEPCGSGHAVRGIALVEAAQRAGVDLRAFGPPVRPSGPAPDLTGYEASIDWRQRVLTWRPDLLIGDLRPEFLEMLRAQLAVPSWMLMRIWPKPWRGAPLWDRVIAIEPGAESLPFLTDAIPPIVGHQRVWPEPRAELHAGYSSFWEAAAYGYADWIRWIVDGNPEQQVRVRLGGGMTENGADVLVAMIMKRLT